MNDKATEKTEKLAAKAAKKAAEKAAERAAEKVAEKAAVKAAEKGAAERKAVEAERKTMAKEKYVTQSEEAKFQRRNILGSFEPAYSAPGHAALGNDVLVRRPSQPATFLPPARPLEASSDPVLWRLVSR